MAEPYLKDLRRRMVRAVEAGRSCHEVARLFGVSPSCVIKPMQRCRATGEVRPAKFGGWPLARLAIKAGLGSKSAFRRSTGFCAGRS